MSLGTAIEVEGEAQRRPADAALGTPLREKKVVGEAPEMSDISDMSQADAAGCAELCVDEQADAAAAAVAMLGRTALDELRLLGLQLGGVWVQFALSGKGAAGRHLTSTQRAVAERVGCSVSRLRCLNAGIVGSGGAKFDAVVAEWGVVSVGGDE